VWVIGFALQSKCIERLTDAFLLVDKKHREILKEINEFISDDRCIIYRKYQDAYKNIIPYLSISTKDYDYMKITYAKNPLELLTNAGLFFNQFFQLKRYLELITPKVNSDLFECLINFIVISEDELNGLSYKIQPRIMTLTIPFDMSFHRYTVEILKQYKLPLCVEYKDELYQGAMAIKVMTNWLGNLVKKKILMEDDKNGFLNLCIDYVSSYNQGNIVSPNNQGVSHHSIFRRRKSSPRLHSTIERNHSTTASSSTNQTSTAEIQSEHHMSNSSSQHK
jgi:hypothetical protein